MGVIQSGYAFAVQVHRGGAPSEAEVSFNPVEWKADRRIPYSCWSLLDLTFSDCLTKGGSRTRTRAAYLLRVMNPWLLQFSHTLCHPHLGGLVSGCLIQALSPQLALWLRLLWASQCWPRTLRPEHPRSCPPSPHHPALPPAVSAMSWSFPVQRPLCFLIRCGSEALKPHDKPVLTLSWHQLREK